MLAPNAPVTKSILASIYTQQLTLNGYAHTSQNTVLGKVPTDPAWLNGVRKDLDLLRAAGNSWTAESPAFLGEVPAQFIDISTTFQSFAKTIDKLIKQDTVDIEFLIELLSGLKAGLNQKAKASSEIGTRWQARIDQFRNVTPLLEKSIQDGWSALDDEEQKVVEIAQQLTKLQDEIASLSQSVDSAAISGGKSVVSSSVSIIFKLVTTAGEASVPYLSLATMGFTIGKMYYDVISDTLQIADDLKKVAALQTEASQEAQAAAATKMVLQLLYQMEIHFAAVETDVPRLSQVWEGEAGKVEEMIQGLRAGADPKNYLDIAQIDAAVAVWTDLQDFAQKMATMHRQIGIPVDIDIASATISKGDTTIRESLLNAT